MPAKRHEVEPDGDEELVAAAGVERRVGGVGVARASGPGARNTSATTNSTAKTSPLMAAIRAAELVPGDTGSMGPPAPPSDPGRAEVGREQSDLPVDLPVVPVGCLRHVSLGEWDTSRLATRLTFRSVIVAAVTWPRSGPHSCPRRTDHPARPAASVTSLSGQQHFSPARIDHQGRAPGAVRLGERDTSRLVTRLTFRSVIVAAVTWPRPGAHSCPRRTDHRARPAASGTPVGSPPDSRSAR